MAKNCNVKCPAGLTTNSEVFDGDPRALGQYFLNIAHECREILASLGFKSMREARGRSDYLHLVKHPSAIGQMNLRNMLQVVKEVHIKEPVYLEANFEIDDIMLKEFKNKAVQRHHRRVKIVIDKKLDNRNKDPLAGSSQSTSNACFSMKCPRNMPGPCRWSIPMTAAETCSRSKRLKFHTHGSAGQSYGAFCNAGMVFHHTGTCNDGVGKGASGGNIAIHSPGGGEVENYLIGNFALFGASSCSLFVEGGAGDRVWRP